MPLPSLLASSVIRGSQLGESHGGLYLVDLGRGRTRLVMDWNTTAIDVAGRGGDRGLRGIAFHREYILVAANSELLFLDQDFNVVDSFTNPYLRHCHEISVADGRAFLAATGYDSVLSFDLRSRRFTMAWHLAGQGASLTLHPFDPNIGTGTGAGGGPPPGHDFHINSVTATATSLHFSGLHTPGLLCADRDGLRLVADLPRGTHNAQILGDGVLYNDTAADQVCHRRGAAITAVPVPDFDPARIENRERFTSAVARPRFARGLCVIDAARGLVAGGSSPSTVAVYDLRAGACVSQVNLSMDVRNAVHGLAVWPFSE